MVSDIGCVPLAGAGGIEPPNGGIKIRCLTAWLRPNAPEKAANLGGRAEHNDAISADQQKCRLHWPAGAGGRNPRAALRRGAHRTGRTPPRNRNAAADEAP